MTLRTFPTGETSRQAEADTVLPVTRASYNVLATDLLGGIRRLHAEHGPIAALDDGSQRVVFLFSPKFNQQVLSDPNTFHARFFAIRGPKGSAQRRLTSGLLSMNGEQHRRNRRLVKEPFGLRAIATYGDAIHRLTDELLQSWRPGQTIDMEDEMRKFMLRVTSTLLFGFDHPDQAYRLGDMLAEWVGLNHRLGTGALVPHDFFNEHYEDLLQFADRLEAEILELIRERRQNPEAGGDVLSILVRSHDEEGGLSDEELVGQAAVLFGAAHMTTAHSFSWTLLLLAQHPDVMERLSLELPSTHRCAANSGPIGTVGGESDCLLDRVIKESMRILPASAYSQRVNMKAVKIGPLKLPRGTGIVFTPLVVHHLPEIYSNPRRFDPDRWVDFKPTSYEYLPFGAGPRMCIGGPLAMGILRTVLPRILTRYRLSVEPDATVDVQVECTMLAPISGIPMRVHQPDGQFTAAELTGTIHELVEFAQPVHV